MRRMLCAPLALVLLVAANPVSAPAQTQAPDQAATPDSTRRPLPFSISHLSAKDLGDVIATSLLGGLHGRIAGVRSIQASGEPGSEVRFQIRGATAIAENPDPVIIIDGTISHGSLADLAADDIARIEVLKGPSASAIYGSDAAAGVILVFTRRGKDAPDGKLQVRLRNEAGPSFMRGGSQGSDAHPFQITTDPGGQVAFVRDGNGNRILEADHVADNPYPRYFDQQSLLYRSGLFLANHLSLSWRNGPTNLFASLDNSRDEGTVFALSGFRRRNIRLNLDRRLGPVEVAVSGVYGWSDGSFAPGSTGPFVAAAFVEPHVDLKANNPDGTPYQAVIPDRLGNASNPLYALANQRYTSDGERLIGGATLRWQPIRGISIEGSHHIERNDVDSALTIPVGYLSSFSIVPPSPGFVQREFFVGRSHTTEAAVVTVLDWGGAKNTSRVGYVYASNSAADSVFAGDPTTPEFGSISSLRTESNVKSVYGTTSLAVRERYIIDVAVRRDVLSYFAPEARALWYYRLGGLWRANQDLHLGGLDELQVHAAFGTAGQRPPIFFGGFFPQVGSVLRVPKAGELELGASLKTRDGRLAFDYTFSRKRTRDVIDVAGIPSPGGFVLTLVNAGALQATTHELTLGYAAIRTSGLSWDLALTGDRVRQEITEFGIGEHLAGDGSPPFHVVGLGKGSGVFYGTRFVRTIPELYDDPDKQALSGSGQAFDPANFVVNEEGYVVAKASWRCGEDHLYRDGRGACTTPERPILYDTIACPSGVGCPPFDFVPIGNSMPDFVVGLQSTLRRHRVGLGLLVDWSQGGDVYSLTRQSVFLEQRDPVFDQRGKPEEERKSIEYYRAFYNALGNGPASSAYFVESGTYVKLRELSLTYDFHLGRLDHVRAGLIGRNLLTLTGYSGQDPEQGDPSDPFLIRTDFFRYPRFRTVSATVQIDF